jgi:hypothetical protein
MKKEISDGCQGCGIGLYYDDHDGRYYVYPEHQNRVPVRLFEPSLIDLWRLHRVDSCPIKMVIDKKVEKVTAVCPFGIVAVVG